MVTLYFRTLFLGLHEIYINLYDKPTLKKPYCNKSQLCCAHMCSLRVLAHHLRTVLSA